MLSPKRITSLLALAVLFCLFASPAIAGILQARGNYRVPANELNQYNDAGRSWILIFSTGGTEMDNFLQDAIKSYGFGNTVRVKTFTAADRQVWDDYKVYHGGWPTILTLSPDGKTVLSIASLNPGTISGKEIPRLPSIQPDDPTGNKRRIELAKLLVLEDLSGEHGRLLNPNKPPYWLPAIRYEQWNNRPCPDCDNHPQPKDTSVNVQIGPPQMDPGFALSIQKIDESSNWENMLPLYILGGVLALVAAIVIGLKLSDITSGSE